MGKAAASMRTTSIREGLDLLVPNGTIVELRALRTSQGVVSGYFSDLERLAQEADRLSGSAEGVYITANPVTPDLLARASNRTKGYAKHVTGDRDIARRTRLIIDIDPVRPSGISATEQEHRAALERAGEVESRLGREGWPEPIIIDSGNGALLLYGIDLPNDEANGHIIRRCLQALDLLFSDQSVAIDTAVFNAARLIRVPGTLNTKGDAVPDRPHRLARIVKAPDKYEVVPVELLERLAALAPETSKPGLFANGQGGALDLDRWIEEHRRPVVSSGPYQGGRKWVLASCPWNRSHNNRSAFIIQFPGGGIAAGCLHNGCRGKGWPDLRDAVEPGWRAQEGADSANDAQLGRNPWTGAQSIAALLSQKDPETPWLERPLLALGAVTEVFSPRGLGKTQVAYAKAVALARQGKRVLLLDRDNSPREVKRRLRAWGADEVPSLKVMIRDQVPPLTDAAAWATFPASDYDFVIIDSLDSTAEGIGEKDSAKPSKALKPILDLARRTNGPAVLILGNTVRSGQHSRGSGVIEDRADICFEVRDATDFRPSGTKDWWLELPSADAGAWGQRASRRKRRDTYRLAFVPTKFRLGEEPDPFVLEIDLTSEPWSLRDVTQKIAETGTAVRAQAEEERRTRLDNAARALCDEIHRRADAGEEPMLKDRDAEPFLKGIGLKRMEARTLIESGAPGLWRLEQMTDRPGQPVVLVPVAKPPKPSAVVQSEDVTAESIQSKTPRKQTTETPTVSADRMNTERRKPESRQPAPDAAIREDGFFPPSVSHTPGAEPEASTLEPVKVVSVEHESELEDAGL